jgi:uncharacterized membrane protein YwzB
MGVYVVSAGILYDDTSTALILILVTMVVIYAICNISFDFRHKSDQYEKAYDQ